MDKKRLAKEWLFFVVALGFGLSILPIILIFALDPNPKMANLGEFYRLLFSGVESVLVWLFALSPYIVIQLVRSIIWAIKTIRFA